MQSDIRYYLLTKEDADLKTFLYSFNEENQQVLKEMVTVEERNQVVITRVNRWVDMGGVEREKIRSLSLPLHLWEILVSDQVIWAVDTLQEAPTNQQVIVGYVADGERRLQASLYTQADKEEVYVNLRYHFFHQWEQDWRPCGNKRPGNGICLPWHRWELLVKGEVRHLIDRKVKEIRGNRGLRKQAPVTPSAAPEEYDDCVVDNFMKTMDGANENPEAIPPPAYQETVRSEVTTQTENSQVDEATQTPPSTPPPPPRNRASKPGLKRWLKKISPKKQKKVEQEKQDWHNWESVQDSQVWSQDQVGSGYQKGPGVNKRNLLYPNFEDYGLAPPTTKRPATN